MQKTVCERNARPECGMYYCFNETNSFSKLVEEEKNKYKRAKRYWLCEEKLKPNDKSLTDFCHLAGKDRTAKHQSCNSKVKKSQTSFVPILSQSFSEYVFHLIIETSISSSPSFICFFKLCLLLLNVSFQ